MHLIDDINLIFSGLRWYTDLINEVTDIIYRVVGCSIKFVYTERITVLKGFAAVAFATGLSP
ncbi:hypothetical protein D3C73_1013910 [compost metagenome]